MRTDSEILDRIQAVEFDDWLGTQRGDLITALSFSSARRWLKAGVTSDEWKPCKEDDIRALAAEYLDFAFGKALNHRGISAGRSIDHFRAWLWLLDAEPDGWETMPYRLYGVPMLLAAADALGVDPFALPAVIESREAVERMGRGEPCEPDCMDGC